MLCLIVIARYWSDPPADVSPSQPLEAGLHRVVRVVDGDTIIVEPDHVVRLIGVDTPETVKPDHPVERFGPEATTFTKRFLSGGTARLTFDRERVDRFGRFLAYVWVGDSMLNEELLRVGLARFESHFPYSAAMKDRFRRAQDEARESQLGIWSPNPDSASRSPRRQFSSPRVALVRAWGKWDILPSVVPEKRHRWPLLLFSPDGDRSCPPSNRFPMATTPPRRI